MLASCQPEPAVAPPPPPAVPPLPSESAPSDPRLAESAAPEPAESAAPPPAPRWVIVKPSGPEPVLLKLRFAFGSAALPKEAEPVLAEIAEVMRAHPATRT